MGSQSLLLGKGSGISEKSWGGLGSNWLGGGLSVSGVGQGTCICKLNMNVLKSKRLNGREQLRILSALSWYRYSSVLVVTRSEAELRDYLLL